MIMEVVLALRWYGICMVGVWKSWEDGLISYAESGSKDFHKEDTSLELKTMLNIFGFFGDFAIVIV